MKWGCGRVSAAHVSCGEKAPGPDTRWEVHAHAHAIFRKLSFPGNALSVCKSLPSVSRPCRVRATPKLVEDCPPKQSYAQRGLDAGLSMVALHPDRSWGQSTGPFCQQRCSAKRIGAVRARLKASSDRRAPRMHLQGGRGPGEGKTPACGASLQDP